MLILDIRVLYHSLDMSKLFLYVYIVMGFSKLDSHEALWIFRVARAQH